MDIPAVRSTLLVSSTLSTSSSSSHSNSRLLYVGAESWLVGDAAIQQILAVVQPSIASEDKRKEVIQYLQQLIEGKFRVKVLVCGSVPLKTYLRHGDIDVTICGDFGNCEELASAICSLLEDEGRNQVEEVISVPAQVRTVKCLVKGIAVDISFNQAAGIYALDFLEKANHFVGKGHLFKLSIILTKSWCYYESRLLGGFYGLLTSYALQIMVLHVLNHFHSSLHSPLAVLYTFLDYYSRFDWTNYGVAFNGLVILSSLPNLAVVPLPNCGTLLLTKEFLESSRDVILHAIGVDGNQSSGFPLKFLNILDPLKEDNNLGRSVQSGSFFRIKSAFSYGAKRLREVLVLPPEQIKMGLEIFFKNTLKKNGFGTRVDVSVPVPFYGSDNYDLSYPVARQLLNNCFYSPCYLCDWQQLRIPLPTVIPRELQLQNPSFEENWIQRGMFTSFDSTRNTPLNNVVPSVGSLRVDNLSPRGVQSSFEDKRKERGTSPVDSSVGMQSSFEEKKKTKGTPPVDSPRGRKPSNPACLEAKGKQKMAVVEVKRKSRGTYKPSCNKRESGEESERRMGEECEILDSHTRTLKESNISSETEGSRSPVIDSMDDFPCLPKGNPVPIRQPPSVHIKNDQERESCPTLSEAGKHSDDGSICVDALNELVIATCEEDKDSSEITEKMNADQSLQLNDESEFPPLVRPPQPVIGLSKKDFPPLSACWKSQIKGKGKFNP